MGRDSGFLALMAGIAGGAEMVVIPEVKTEPEDVARELRQPAKGKHTLSWWLRRAPNATPRH